MTERRISEVVLGALLATAIWALALLFHFVGDIKLSETSLKIADLTFKIIAGIFAAGWALYLLKLIHRPLANAGLLKSKMELEEYQQKKSLLAGLALSLQATAHRIPGRPDFVIIVTADLTNRTESDVLRIEWEEDPLHVWMTNFDAQGRPTYKGGTGFFVRRTSNPKLKAMPLRIRPGATESLSFAVGVSEPGIYLVTLRIPLEPRYLEEVRNFDMHMPGSWTRNAHVIVGDTPEPSPALESDQFA